ncbi:unnamed protein product [Didymodactylos carnosus]|uniref:NHL repeat containing protein n=1 Tax=Didymodactylos carnosus TaxID=1234261 RepID=A0A8S2EGA9_9BILA|nr:unnamed protein product [Didymodactylos carnosus]CAF3968043.1 unnamed protein product [Didymodactylos carnosus]
MATRSKSSIRLDINQLPEMKSKPIDKDKLGGRRYCFGQWDFCLCILLLIGVATAVSISLGVILSLNKNNDMGPSTTALTSVTTTALTSVTTTAMTSVTTTAMTSVTTTAMTSITTTIDACSFRWNLTGITVAGRTGINGVLSDQLNSPYGIFIDLNNDLYVADYNNHRIQKWLNGASTGTTIAGLTNGTSGLTSNQLYYPSAIYVDRKNQNLYIDDSGNHRVQLWNNSATSGTTVAGITGNGGNGSNQFSFIYGIWVDSNENIYVTDRDNHRVMKWTSGNISSGTIVVDQRNGQLNMTYGIYLDEVNNSVYISDFGTNIIMKLVLGASNGTIIAGISGTSGSNSTLMNGPSSITLDQYGNLYVADSQNHRVQMFCPNSLSGITIVGGSSGLGSTQLHSPLGLALDSNLNLYVSDSKNHRIQKFMKL